MRNTMRIISKIVIAGLICLLVSCEDDNDKPNTSIIGRWKFVSIVINGVTHPESIQDFIVEFKNDNTFTWSSIHDGVPTPSGGTYEYANGNLTTVENGVTTHWLCEISGNEMRLTLTDPGSGTHILERL